MAEFRNAHAKAIAFFNLLFQKAAALENRSQDAIRPLLHALTFPEVEELQLGYSKGTSRGAGSGAHFSRELLKAIFALIDAGVKSVSRFEELALFGDGFGADRIGDMLGSLLRPQIARYTKRICARSRIGTANVRLRHFAFDRSTITWNDGRTRLPVVRFVDGSVKSVCLVPKVFLRQLPTAGIEDFWDYCYANENATLRQQFGTKIKKGIDRRRIISIARHSRLLRERYLASLATRMAEPYDTDDDPQLLHKWYAIARDATAARRPIIPQATSLRQFQKTVGVIVGEFKSYIEDEGGWMVINGKQSHGGVNEPTVQRLFHGIVMHYCRANDIDSSPEVQTGSGLIDFKFSAGYRHRALTEIKLARNPRLLHGIQVQVPAYCKSSRLSFAFLGVVLYADSDVAYLGLARNAIQKVNAKGKLHIHLVPIDARPKLSASKRKAVKSSTAR